MVNNLDPLLTGVININCHTPVINRLQKHCLCAIYARRNLHQLEKMLSCLTRGSGYLSILAIVRRNVRGHLLTLCPSDSMEEYLHLGEVGCINHSLSFRKPNYHLFRITSALSR